MKTLFVMFQFVSQEYINKIVSQEYINKTVAKFRTVLFEERGLYENLTLPGVGKCLLFRAIDYMTEIEYSQRIDIHDAPESVRTLLLETLWKNLASFYGGGDFRVLTSVSTHVYTLSIRGSGNYTVHPTDTTDTTPWSNTHLVWSWFDLYQPIEYIKKRIQAEKTLAFLSWFQWTYRSRQVWLFLHPHTKIFVQVNPNSLDYIMIPYTASNHHAMRWYRRLYNDATQKKQIPFLTYLCDTYEKDRKFSIFLRNTLHKWVLDVVDLVDPVLFERPTNQQTANKQSKDRPAEELQDADQQDTDQQDADQQDADQQDADQQDADPQNADPQDTDPQDTDPQDADPQDVESTDDYRPKDTDVVNENSEQTGDASHGGDSSSAEVPDGSSLRGTRASDSSTNPSSTNSSAKSTTTVGGIAQDQEPPESDEEVDDPTWFEAHPTEPPQEFDATEFWRRHFVGGGVSPAKTIKGEKRLIEQLAAIINNLALEFDETRRVDGRKLVRALTTRHIRNIYREHEAKRPAILWIADISGSCAHMSLPSLRVAHAATVLGKTTTPIIATTIHNVFRVLQTINGFDVTTEMTKYHPVEYVKLIEQRFGVSIEAVIAVGDGDEYETYTTLAEYGLPVFWIDHYRCRSSGPTVGQLAYYITHPNIKYVYGCKYVKDILRGLELLIRQG